MSKEPVNLFGVGGERFPVGGHLLNSLAYIRATFDATWPALELLMRHVGETSGGMNHDGTAITDDELAFHQLSLSQISDTLDELTKKCNQVAAENERRTWTVITNRGSLGMIAFGKSFTATGKMIPSMPKTDTPEHAELMAWLEQEGYAEFIKPAHVGFQSMQKILDDLAEKQKPRPPHVEAIPVIGVTVK